MKSRSERLASLGMLAAVLCLIVTSSAQGQAPTTANAQSLIVVRSISWNEVTETRVQALMMDHTKQLESRSLSDAGIEEVAQSLTRALREAGYPIARVLVRSDSHAHFRRSGALEFSVFEGKVGAVTIKNSSSVTDRRVQATAEAALCPSGLGDKCVLSTDAIERTTQLLQDIPGVKLAGTEFSAVNVAVGETRMVFETVSSGPRVTGLLSVDNYGIPATGLNRIWLGASINNLFGQGEVIDATLGTTNMRQNTGRLGVGVPIGYQGWRATASASRTNFAVSAAGTPIGGSADTYTVGASYPVLRGLDRNLVAAIDAVTVKSRTEAEDFGVTLSEKRLSALKFSVLGNTGDRAQFYGSSYWSYGASVLAGHVSDSIAGQADPAGVTGSYVKLAANVVRRHTLDVSQQWYLLANVRGQVANKNLDPYEKLAIGGPFGVRAYRGDEGSVDNGLIATIELRRRLNIGDSLQLLPGVFVDYATGYVNHSEYANWQTLSGFADPNISNHRSLAGYGLGMDAIWTNRVVTGLAWARRLSASADSANYPGSANGRFWATVSVRY